MIAVMADVPAARLGGLLDGAAAATKTPFFDS